MSAFNPNKPELNSLRLGQRVSKQLQTLLPSNKKMMSVGRFFKTMKNRIGTDHAMTDKMAKVVSLRAAVGTDLGVSSKKEKVFVKEMGKEHLLSERYKRQDEYEVLDALHQYHEKVAESGSNAQVDQHVTGEQTHDATISGHKGADRMAKIRAEIEAQKQAHQQHDVSLNHSLRAEEEAGAVTSIGHVTTKSSKPAEETALPIVPTPLD